MIAKAPVEWFVHGLDGDLDGGGLFADFGRDGYGTVGDGNGFVFFDADDMRIAGDELDVVCDLANELVVANFFEDELLARFGAVEGNGRRKDSNAVCGGCQAWQQCKEAK
jgi:hypothetical protein